MRRFAMIAFLAILLVILLNCVSRTMPNPDLARSAPARPRAAAQVLPPRTGGY